MAVAGRGHVQHLAFAPSKLLDDDAGILFGDINLDFFQRLHALAVFLVKDDFRLGDLQLVAFPAHGLNQDR